MGKVGSCWILDFLVEGFDDIRFVDCEAAKFGASCSVKVGQLDFLVFADKFQYQKIDAGKGNEVELEMVRRCYARY